MNQVLGVGVVGIGYGQQVHVPAFRAAGRCQVVALCAGSQQRARTVADRLDVPKAYGDWRELLADPEVGAVSIAVPPALQAPVVMAAAVAGKPVFCEKPVAPNSAQAQAMLAAVQDNGVAHAVDFLFGEVPAWQRTKALLDAGALGRLRHAALTWRVETYAWRHQTNSWKLHAEDGGGTLNNFASHTLFCLEWLFGPIKAITARLAPPPPASDVRVDAWLEFQCGLFLSLAVAADAFLGSGHRLEIYGDEGTAVLENTTRDYVRGFQLWHGTRRGEALLPVPLETPSPAGDGRLAPTTKLVRRFVDAVLDGGQVTPNLQTGLRVQQLIDALRAAARSQGRQVV